MTPRIVYVPITRPTDTLSPSERERDGVRGRTSHCERDLELHEPDTHGAGQPFQHGRMMPFKHGDVMRHSRMTEFLEPFARVLLVQPREGIRAHQVPFGFDGLALSRGQEVVAVAAPETHHGDRHFLPERRLHHRRLLYVEMPGNARSARLTHRGTEPHRRGATMPQSDRLVVVLKPVGQIAPAHSQALADPGR